jgi:hypothetical protein
MAENIPDQRTIAIIATSAFMPSPSPYKHAHNHDQAQQHKHQLPQRAHGLLAVSHGLGLGQIW